MKHFGIVLTAVIAFVVWSTKAYTDPKFLELVAMLAALGCFVALYWIGVMSLGMWYDIFTAKNYSWGRELSQLDREQEWLLFAEGP